MAVDTQKDTRPPYGGFGSFWNFVRQLHDGGEIPQVLDRSVLGSRGGSARAELYTALKFFSLVDDDKRPTQRLRALAVEPSKSALRGLLEESYAPVIELGLASATPTQVGEKLAEMGATPSIVQRARTFFLNAADEAELPVGTILKTARAPSSAPRRRAKPKTAKVDETEPPTSAPALPPVIGALVAKLPAESEGWTEAAARQWLGLVAPAIAYDYDLDLSQLVGTS